jgi:hypothetical protein
MSARSDVTEIAPDDSDEDPDGARVGSGFGGGHGGGGRQRTLTGMASDSDDSDEDPGGVHLGSGIGGEHGGGARQRTLTGMASDSDDSDTDPVSPITRWAQQQAASRKSDAVSSAAAESQRSISRPSAIGSGSSPRTTANMPIASSAQGTASYVPGSGVSSARMPSASGSKKRISWYGGEGSPVDPSRGGAKLPGTKPPGSSFGGAGGRTAETDSDDEATGPGPVGGSNAPLYVKMEQREVYRRRQSSGDWETAHVI